MELEQYVNQNLLSALLKIIHTDKIFELPHLSVYEKAVIFAYTDLLNNKHQELNERLWTSQGTEISEFGLYLEGCLNKLPAHKGLVFRGVNESYCDVNRYIKAMETKSIPEFLFSGNDG